MVTDISNFEIELDEGTYGYVSVIKSASSSTRRLSSLIPEASKRRGIIIIDDDIDVDENFEGLIISSKKIEANKHNVTVTANQTMVQELVLLAVQREECRELFAGINDSCSYGEAQLDIHASISFKNWTKNAE